MTVALLHLPCDEKSDEALSSVEKKFRIVSRTQCNKEKISINEFWIWSEAIKFDY